MNYDKGLQSMKTMISTWKKRNLTVLGRIVVLKSLVLPKLSYVAQMLPNPNDDLIKEVSNMFFKYIWQDKPDRIKRAQFIQKYEDGGVKMPDVESHINALKINWIRRVIQGNKNGYVYLKCASRGQVNTFYCTELFRFIKSRKNEIMNKFWYDTLFAWSSFINIANQEDLDFNRIARQYLWWNDKIKIGNKPVKICSFGRKGCGVYMHNNY